MAADRPYFFCGIGGSGMLPLAMILRGKGAAVSGSDRALDQGRLSEKFDYLRAQGIALHPQDGSGVRADMTVVISAAVESTVPDVEAARRLGAQLMVRAELLAQLFNAAGRSIGVAGTSGKSTTTGMIGWILSATGRDPTVMNGAVMKNFVRPDALFASALVGSGDLFVSEVDESDGSIARYDPKVAVLNNVALDHKSMDELRRLFGDFVAKAGTTVVNLDNAEAAALVTKARCAITYSTREPSAALFATAIVPAPDGISFKVHEDGFAHAAAIKVPGRHNVSNALAALAAARAVDVPLADAVRALADFAGIKRRLDVAGTAGGVTVIDDFAHNPDKISATFATLHDFPGRLLVMFQPHGYMPLKLMKDDFIEVFATKLDSSDVLVMPEPAYFGGTTDRSVSSSDIVAGVAARGRPAFALPDRAACGAKLLSLAKPGDRIVVMGARDDTLSQFAAELVAGLS